MIEKIRQSSDFLTPMIAEPPEIGMITGTGLGSLTDKIDVALRIPYEEIPNFPRSTTEGHTGALVIGKLAEKQVISLEGRFHLYEGYTAQEISFPVRVMADLGVKYLLISSAAGGLNPQFTSGDLMLVTDHINLTGTNPLTGPNLELFGPRFPDMTEVYPHDLVELAREKALDSGLLVRQGVYIGVAGPSLETPSETRFFRMIGGDAIGMSTVSEAIAGVHCGLKVLAIVVITNVNLPDCMEKTLLEDVIASAEKAGAKLGLLWEKIVEKLVL